MTIPTRLRQIGTLGVTVTLALLAAVIPVTTANAATGVDLVVSTAGPSAANGGAPFSYTVTLQNNGIAVVSPSFVFTPPAGATAVSAICSASCGPISVSDTSVSGTLPGSFANQATKTLTISGEYPVGKSSATATATFTPSVADDDPSTNTSSVSTALNVIADLAVTNIQSKSTINPGDTVRYTTTVTNSGPSAADGAQISHSIDGVNSASLVFGDWEKSLVSCTPSGGAVCPDFTQIPYSAEYLYAMPVLTLPASSGLVIVFDVTFPGASTPGCGSLAGWKSDMYVSAPSGVVDGNPTNNGAEQTATSPISPCRNADVRVTKTQSQETIAAGDTVEYVLTAYNDGPDAADGARWSDQLIATGIASDLFGDVTTEFLGCSEFGGAVCPATFADQTNPFEITGIFSLFIPTFPSESRLEVVYRVTYEERATPPTACGPSAGWDNNTTITSPAGVIDQSPENNRDSVSATSATTACTVVRADVSIDKTQSQTTILPGDTVRYTVTASNSGLHDADGSTIHDTFTAEGHAATSFGDVTATFVSCAGENGATCPNTLADGTYPFDGFNTMFDLAIPTFPTDSSIEIVYDVTFAPRIEVIACGPHSGWTNTAYINLPAGLSESNVNNNMASTFASVGDCADVSVNKSVSPTSVSAGDPITYTIVTSNFTANPADFVEVEDVLPAQFIYADSTCDVTSGTAVCGPIDVSNGTVRMTIPSLAAGDNVVLTISGTANLQPGSFTNTATAKGTAGRSAYFDPIASSDSSNVNVQINNSSSPIVVTKSIAGLPASGLPDDLTFTGTITCDVEGAKPWSATVDAGDESGAASAVSFLDGQTCVIAEDAPPGAPAGYLWSPTVLVTPSMAVLGNSTPFAARVTNTLIALPVGSAAVLVTKQIVGLSAGGLTEDETFSGTVTCGIQPAQSWSATVLAGQSSGTGNLLDFDAADTCVTTEDGIPNAPDGYVWKGVPKVSPSTTTTLADGQVATVAVINTLAAQEASADDDAADEDGSGDLASTGLHDLGITVALSLLLLALGLAIVLLRRRQLR